MSGLQEIHEQRSAAWTERNGVRIPHTVSGKEAVYKGLRENALMIDYSHYAIVEVRGDGGFDLLDHVVAGDVASIRDEQALYSVILDEKGEIVTDVYVLCDDDRYLVLSEWVAPAELVSLLEGGRRAGEDVALEAKNALRVVYCEGPYSWEVMADIFGMDVIGLPYMEHMAIEGGLLFRCGKHGEYGYKAIVDEETAIRLLSDPEEKYRKFDLVYSGVDFQEIARLENPGWNPEGAGKTVRCPIELQMQWAVRYDKESFVGKAAIEERLAQGAQRRVVGIVAEAAAGRGVSVGTRIAFQGEEVGTILTYGYSPKREAFVGQALLDARYAYADIAGFEAVASEGRVPVQTAAVPFIRNFSFLVSAADHSYVDASRPKNLLEQLSMVQAEQAST